QRRNARYSPDSRSISTRTSTSSLKRFLVAEASAISSARKTVSFATFFSRASASTSSKMSRLIIPSSFPRQAGIHYSLVIPAAGGNPLSSDVRHQPGAIDILECNMVPLSLRFQHHATLFHSDHAPLVAPASFHRQLEPHRSLAAGEAGEILQPLERAVQPGRGHLQPLVVHAFHREEPGEVVAHQGAIVDRHPARRVDEDPQQARARRLEIDELVAQALERRAQPLFLLANGLHKQKMGARPISRGNPGILARNHISGRENHGPAAGRRLPIEAPGALLAAAGRIMLQKRNMGRFHCWINHLTSVSSARCQRPKRTRKPRLTPLQVLASPKHFYNTTGGLKNES